MMMMILEESLKEDEYIVNYVVNPAEGRSYWNPKRRRDEIIPVEITMEALQKKH
jgi:hypothetical protein